MNTAITSERAQQKWIPQAGDKVWIDRTEFVENAQMIREVQTIESVMPIPLTDQFGNAMVGYAIYLVGSGFVYTEEELRPAEGYKDSPTFVEVNGVAGYLPQ
jgi:hypothetical protein